MYKTDIDEKHCNEIDKAIYYIAQYCKQYESQDCKGCELVIFNACCLLHEFDPTNYMLNNLNSKNERLLKNLEVLISYCAGRKCEDCTITLIAGDTCMAPDTFTNWYSLKKEYLAHI